MKKAKVLNEERGSVVEKMQALVDKSEGREMTPDENVEFDAFRSKLKELDIEIERAEAAEKLIRKTGSPEGVISGDAELIKLCRDFSLTKAIRSQMPNGKLDGAELEVMQESQRRQAKSGLATEGFVIDPSLFRDAYSAHKRAMSVGTNANGGYTVETTLGAMIEALYPKLKTEELGATIMTGLQGNLTLPRNTVALSAAWESETSAADSTDPTLEQLSLTPHRLAAYTDISLQLLSQSSLDVEKFIAGELGLARRIKLDLAAINGSGASNQPTGILNTSGIGSVAGGTNGLAPAWSHIIDLESSITTNNADLGNLAYLTTPGVRGKLKKTENSAGTNGVYIWGKGDELNGYMAHASTQVPSTLTKGSSSGVCHAILFGNWKDLIIATWGLIDLTVDNVSLKKDGKISIIVNAFHDIGVRHPKSFAAMVDALIS